MTGTNAYKNTFTASNALYRIYGSSISLKRGAYRSDIPYL